MRRSTFKILFYVNKQRMKEGRIPVYARLTVNVRQLPCNPAARLVGFQSQQSRRKEPRSTDGQS